MSLNILTQEDCDEILEELQIKKISIVDKLDRLKKRMTDSQFDGMKKDFESVSNIETEDKNELKKQVLERYMRQFALPFRIKRRTFDLTKYYDLKLDGLEKEKIQHLGIFFDKDGTIYHFIPEGVTYGKKEYDREITCYYEWQTRKGNAKKAFFTLVTHQEIEEFVKKWNEIYEYDPNLRSSEMFVLVLTYWLK